MVTTTKEKFRIYAPIVISNLQSQISILDTLYRNNENYLNEHLEIDTQKLIDDYNSNHKLHTNEELEEAEFFAQYVNDFFSKSFVTRDFLSQYIIVACFSLYEKGIKKILSLTDIFDIKGKTKTNVNMNGKSKKLSLDDCFKKVVMESLLNDIFNISYSNLNESKLVEELRCLNNDIKHNGKVREELAKVNNKWQEGQLIGNVYEDFNRLKDAPENFLNDLITKLSPQI